MSEVWRKNLIENSQKYFKKRQTTPCKLKNVSQLNQIWWSGLSLTWLFKIQTLARTVVLWGENPAYQLISLSKAYLVYASKTRKKPKLFCNYIWHRIVKTTEKEKKWQQGFTTGWQVTGKLGYLLITIDRFANSHVSNWKSSAEIVCTK